MTSEVVVLYNPLDVSRRRRVTLADGTPLLAWADENEPAPGECGRSVFVNGHACTDPDYCTHPGDEVLVRFEPGTLASVAVFVLKVIIEVAIAYVLTRLFAPKRPAAADTPAPSQVYGIAPPRNTVRIGQPIPVIYGTVVALPDFAAQPYTFFRGNEMFLHALLCLGQGEFVVHEMLLGQTTAATLPAGVVTYGHYPPSFHQQTFGVIQSGVLAVRENVVSSPAVGDQELVATNSGGGPPGTKWVGWFETCKQTQRGALIELDFVFPGGLFVSDSSGNLNPCTVQVTIEAQPIDGAGADAGALLTWVEAFTASDNTPQRITRSQAVASGRYKVRASRLSASDGKVTTSDRVIWAGLKFELDPPPPGTKVYGDVTLLAVVLKATNGVAAEAAGSMRFRCTRKLPPLGAGAPAASVNPADAFVDVLCSAYGGVRPVNPDELDLDELTASRAAWEGHNGVNAVFDQPSTVWEALGLVVQTVHAAPLPVGSRMSLVHDEVQPVRSQLFTDANIVAGSLQVNFAFDQVGTPEGVRVNFRDPQTFQAVSIVQPVDALDYQAVELFGCTSGSVATQHATLIRAKQTKQRRTIAFDTELEGLNVLPGHRIGVQASMIKWAQGARVVSVAGLTLRLDRPLVWTPAAAHAALLRDPLGVPWRAAGVTRGGSDFELVLPSAPPFTVTGANATQEATALSFGVASAEVTDWTVVRMTPNGDTVSVEAVNYDPSIYDALPAFTRGATEEFAT